MVPPSRLKTGRNDIQMYFIGEQNGRPFLRSPEPLALEEDTGEIVFDPNTGRPDALVLNGEPLRPGHFYRGRLDRLQREGEDGVLIGWASHLETGKHPAKVMLFKSGKLLTSKDIFERRPAVAQLYKMEQAHVGFRFHLSAPELVGADQGDLIVVAMSPDGKTSFIKPFYFIKPDASPPRIDGTQGATHPLVTGEHGFYSTTGIKDNVWSLELEALKKEPPTSLLIFSGGSFITTRWPTFERATRKRWLGSTRLPAQWGLEESLDSLELFFVWPDGTASTLAPRPSAPDTPSSDPN